MGQKRMFIAEFRKVLMKNIKNGGEGWTIVDVFGGSGLLAHNAKRMLPEARVIYNDFDGYSERLEHINETNEILAKIRPIVAGFKKCERLTDSAADQIRDVFREHSGFFDLQTLQTSVLFSGNSVDEKAELTAKRGEKGHHAFYNSVRLENFSADGYLDGLEVVSRDYLDLLDEFAGEPKTLLLLDPPYINTDQSRYKNYVPFGLCAFLRLMGSIKPPFIFFSSDKSEFPEYVDYLKEMKPEEFAFLFGSAEWYYRTQNSNYQYRYRDNMVSVF